ncbi:hypothetical protein Bca52824_096731 [Brassica carinata]|uniref:Uncharacterized protein n=1 Tax=Brassica carinata TaxID=52824 RepID=A0A8X7NXE1_BRACI|nr:hypothetical protein Bca52824_096731 [Brassica carinata]
MKKNIDVFDFNEEDELAESASGKLLEKFANPSSSISPALQCRRIQSCESLLLFFFFLLYLHTVIVLAEA